MSIRTSSGTRLTYADLCLIPEDGRRHEIIDGEHVVSPAPYSAHQWLVTALAGELRAQITLKRHGKVYVAPIDVELSENDIVEPDVVVVLKRNLSIVTPVRIIGVPDLIAEVLSESTSKLDRAKKKRLYRQASVPEYWIVDGTKRVAEQYMLRGREYELTGRHQKEISFLGLRGVRVDLEQVWETW